MPNFHSVETSQMCSEEYIHLRGAISTEGDAAKVSRLIILPATYTGTPRHMHKYTYNAMTYVHCCGWPNLFFTYTCNPKWIEIVQMLFPGQSSSDRHDITRRDKISLKLEIKTTKTE